MAQREIEHVADTIRAYLDTHPSASDSLDGVLQWWLDPLGTRVSPVVATAALERLIRLGVVESRPLPDGGRLFAARLTRHR